MYNDIIITGSDTIDKPSARMCRDIAYIRRRLKDIDYTIIIINMIFEQRSYFSIFIYIGRVQFAINDYLININYTTDRTRFYHRYYKIKS